MITINIRFTLFSAFYSPLISTLSGGFLQAEGLDPHWSVSPPGVSAVDALEDGSAHVVQTAPSQSFGPLSKGEIPHAIHPGGAADIDKAFRDGQGQYVQQQGPFPQQWEADRVGHVVAQVGRQIGACAFSSLAASRDWLQTDMAAAFMRAYVKTRAYMNKTPAVEIAEAETSYFPNIDKAVLADCIATYQQLGCWTPHVEIARAAFEATLDIFAYNGIIDQRFSYDQVCVAPLAID